MLRILTFLVLSALIVAGAWWVAAIPGHLDLAIGGFAIETTAPVGIALGIAALLVAYFLFRLLVILLTLPRRWRRWRQARRRAAGEHAATRALVALAANAEAPATRQAARARKLLGDTPQTLLIAAEAARLAGDEKAAATAYEALSKNSESAFLGLRGLFRQAVARGDWSGAMRLARRAEAYAPGKTWLIAERAEAAVRAGDWDAALALAGPDLPKVQLATAAALANPDPGQARGLAKRAWNQDPAFPPAAIAYARALRAAGKHARAAAVLRRSWSAAPHPDLAEAALEGIADPMARLRTGAALIRGRPEDVESHLLMARLSLEADLPGEAHRHIEAARATGMDQRRLWLLAARIEDEGEALRRAAHASDPGWACGQCGTRLAAWQPVCPSCGTVGRVAWQTPRTATAVLQAAPAKALPAS
jgi:HemY protein